MGDQRKSVKLTKRAVDAALPASKLYRLWDSDLKGFGLRVMPTGVKSYFVMYRPNGGGRSVASKEYTIGKHGVVTPDEARREAEQKLAAVRLGGDPQAARMASRGELTVTELCDLYLAEGVATRKPASVERDMFSIRAHIKPLLGTIKTSELSHADVTRFVADVAKGKTAVKQAPTAAEAKARGLKEVATFKRTDSRVKGGPVAATRSLALLSAICGFAIKRRLRADNPCTGVKKFKARQSQRYLSVEEAGRLGDVLSSGDFSAKAISVLRLLILTACRKDEIQGLKWSEVDFSLSLLRLDDSKTGQKIVPLAAPALEVLANLRLAYDSEAAAGADVMSPYVFPAKGDAATHYIGTPKVWREIRVKAGIADIRMHDLRHTFASFAASGGQSLLTIGKILGHGSTSTTARYAHLADDPVKAATQKTSEAIAAALGGKTAQVIPLRGKKAKA